MTSSIKFAIRFSDFNWLLPAAFWYLWKTCERSKNHDLIKYGTRLYKNHIYLPEFYFNFFIHFLWIDRRKKQKGKSSNCIVEVSSSSRSNESISHWFNLFLFCFFFSIWEMTKEGYDHQPQIKTTWNLYVNYGFTLYFYFDFRANLSLLLNLFVAFRKNIWLMRKKKSKYEYILNWNLFVNNKYIYRSNFTSIFICRSSQNIARSQKTKLNKLGLPAFPEVPNRLQLRIRAQLATLAIK